MSIDIRLKHSAVNGKAPQPADLSDGELALNINDASPAAYIKDSAGNIVKLAGAGAIGDLWTRTGTELSPVNAGDSVFTTGAVKVGGTTAAPNIEVKADGGIVANTDGLVYDAANQRLGVGTSSPGQTLDIHGSKGAPAYLRIANDSDTNWDTGDVFGGIEFYSADVDSNGPGVNAYIKAVHDRAGSGHTAADAGLVFGTGTPADINAVNRVTIPASGGMYVGPSPDVVTNFGFSTGRSVTGGTGSNDPGLTYIFRNVAGSSNVLNCGGTAGNAVIRGDGDLENTNNRYTGISDAKLKQNIEDASSQWDDIKAIQVRKYEFIARPERKHIGVVAQELEQVCPGLVIERIQDEETGETVKSVAYSVLYMKAVKALQEAMERIETLEAKVAALEAS